MKSQAFFGRSSGHPAVFSSVLVGAALLAGVALSAAPLAAEPLSLLICAPGGPGSTEDARSRLAGFFAGFKKLTGVEVTGEYHTSQEACDRYFAQSKPKLAVFTYRNFMERSTELSLLPVLQIVRKGQGQNRWYLVAKSGTTLDGLKGQAVMTPHLGDATFLSRVAFGGRIDVEKDFKTQGVASALKAIKALAKGEVAGILLNESEYNSLAGLPLAKDFAAVLTSEPQPAVPLVVVGGDTALADKLRQALPGLCQADANACGPLDLESVAAADASTYAPWFRAYAAKPGP
jgi:ABC-type phosphate/phosphonate transport system substrate-binding protein